MQLSKKEILDKLYLHTKVTNANILTNIPRYLWLLVVPRYQF